MGEREASVFAGMLKTLIAAGDTVQTEKELKDLLYMISDAASRIFDAEAASLLLVDEATNTLYFKTATGKKGKVVEDIRLDMGEGVAGLVAREGTPLIVNDAASDRRHDAFLSSLIEFSISNILCVPLRHEDKTIGVIEVMNKRGGGFSSEDQEALTMIATKITPVIVKARTMAGETTTS